MAIKAAELYVKVGAETGEAEKGLLGVSQQLSSVATQAAQAGGTLSGGVMAALGALPGPAGAATVGLAALTGTWGGLTGAMAASGGVMGSVAALLGGALPTAMGATTVSLGLLTAAWTNGWSGMGEATGQTWEGGIRPTLDALTGYLTVTIPGALGTMRGAWERDWAAAAGAINAVSAAFDALVARLSRPLPNPASGIGVPEGSGPGKAAPPKTGGGVGNPAFMTSWFGATPGSAPAAAASSPGDGGEVVGLLRALLVAVQRQERAVTIELDGRAMGHAMSRQRASALLYDARS